MNESCRLKILVAYHKLENYMKDEILTPIQVGRLLREEADEQTRKKMYELMIGDDTGENISMKKNSYCEMAAIYWAWKNYDKIGNPEHIGLMQYRRAFIFDDRIVRPTVTLSQFPNNYLEVIHYSENQIMKYLEEYDFICPRPLYRNTVYQHYKEHHDIEDLDCARQIIKEKYPEFVEVAESYLFGDQSYFFNMFILPKKLFFPYCEWIFGILFELEKRIDISKKRLYVAERLTGIYIKYLMQQGYRQKELSTTFVRGCNDVPVVFSLGEDYVLPTGVAMHSLLANADATTRYLFYILTTEKFSETSQKMLCSLKQRFSNMELQFINMKDAFSNVNLPQTHIKLPTYYRLMAAELLPQHKKAIYLDSDVIVCQDLLELYNQDMTEYFVAGAKAPAYHIYDEKHAIWYANRVGLPDLKQYINAGAILMNLEEIRKAGLVPTFLEKSKSQTPSLDQDILNSTCYGKIKLLPMKYNNMLSKYVAQEKKLLEVFSKEEMEDAEQNPVVIHYCDKQKPWNTMKCKYASIWWKYASESCFRKEVFDTYFGGAMPLTTMEAKKPIKISIIMPIYNMQQYIKQCLDSVLAQTLKEIEIICIDDASTDNSLELLREYEKKDSRIKVISKFHSGSGDTRNMGIHAARGEFLAFMDPDDYYPSFEILEFLYKKAKLNRALICGGSFCEDYQGKIRFDYRKELQKYVFKKDGFHTFKDYQFDYGYTRFIYQRELIEKNRIEFPPYQRFQDPPFFIRAMIAAEKFYAVPEFSYCYRMTHKTVRWTSDKVEDLLNGILDCIELSRKYQLPELHYFCVKHVTAHYYKAIINVEELTPEIIYLLEVINQTIDERLLKKSKETEPIELPIRPLQYFTANEKQFGEVIRKMK